MKISNKLLLILTLIASILVVIAGSIFGILKATNVLETEFSVFELIFMIFTYGFGAIALIYGIIKKGGYESAIGIILLDVAIVLNLVFAKVFWVVTLIVAICLLLLTVLLVFLLNVSKLQVARTNESENFVPYTEVLAQKKAEEKAKEDAEPMPEIKSFKDNLK